MKFGISLFPFHSFPDLPSLVSYVQRAERLGYHSVYLPEHPAIPRQYEKYIGSLWYDFLVLATHLAAVTEKIRLESGIVILPQHNPFYLAKALATLDVVSNGRVSLGIGVGWLEDEFRLLGVDFHKRGALTDEYIMTLRALWGDDPCSFQGKHVSFTDVVSGPKPVQRPSLPIYVGGGMKTSLRRAAALGDGWMPMTGTTEDFKASLAILKEELGKRGRSLEGFTVAKSIPLYDRSQESHEHGRMSGSDAVSTLGGDYSAALEYVQEYKEMGVTQMSIGVLGMEPARVVQEMERFAEKVMALV